MNDIKIREMDKSEVTLLVKWLYAHREVNQFDPEPFRKDQVKIFVAEDETGILCFIPIQTIYIYDALAPRPNISPFRLARAFEKMNEHLAKEAEHYNVSKVLLQPSDSTFSTFAQDTFGFKPVIRETLELKFAREPKCASQ